MAKETIVGLIESQPHNNNYTELYDLISNLQGLISGLESSKANASTAITQSDLLASNIENDTSGVAGADVDNALLGIQNQINALDTSDVANVSEVDASNLTSALTNLKHSIDALTSDDIANVSTIIGTSVTDVVESLDTRIDNIIAQSGTSDTEVVDARYSPILNETFTVLGDRFDNIEEKYLVEDYSTIANTKLAITTFTTGTLDAPMKYQMEGLSVANSVDYVEDDTLTVVENQGVFIQGDGTLGGNPSKAVVSQSVGDEIFQYILFKKNTSSLDSLYYNNGTSEILVGFPIGSLELYKEYTVTGTSGGYIKVLTDSAGDLTLDSAYYINKTQYGITDFTEAEMLNLVHAMASGTSIQNAIADIRTVGKNLVNDNEPIEGLYIAGGIITSNPSSKMLVSKIKSGTTYTAKQFDGNRAVLAYYSEYPVVGSTAIISITGTSVAGTSLSLLAPDDANYVAFYYSFGQEISPKAQIEQNPTSTPYETYKQNLLQQNIELKSVPVTSDTLVNAVVDPDDSNKLLRLDKTVHIKNVSDDYILQSADITGILTSGSNVDIARTDEAFFSDGVITNNANTFLAEGDTVYQNVPESEFDDVNNIGKVTSSNTGRIEFILAKNTSLATAKAALAGKVIQYQLVTPVVTELDIDEMYSFEDGVLYQNGIPASIDYTTATNEWAVLSEVAKTVEKIDDGYASKYIEAGITPTLVNGWTSSDVVYYKDNFDIVHIDGLLQSGTGLAFTLPQSHSPNDDRVFICPNTTTGTPKVTIGTDGTVTPSGEVYLDGITFRAGE